MTTLGNCGRPWTPYEDDLLRAAVAIYGDNTEKWKTIALSVPGRTNKACRKRWLHSLSPSIKKSAWTAEEDRLLLSLFERYPNKWSQISREIPGRTDDACSKRYREALDPNLRKEEWTEEEEARLLDALARYGGATNPKWGLIGQELRRSGLGCRNRWRLLERKRKAALRHCSASQVQTSAQNVFPQLSADIWPLFSEDGSSSYWAYALGPAGVDFVFGETQSGPELRTIGTSGGPTEESYRESATSEPSLALSHATQEPHAEVRSVIEPAHFSCLPPTGTFSCLLSPPSEEQPEAQIPQPTIQTMEGAPLPGPSRSDSDTERYSFEVPVSDIVDYGPSQDDDSFSHLDDDPQEFSVNDQEGLRGVFEDSSHVPEASINLNATNETRNLSSLGTLAHAASTLSPSPCVPFGEGQVQHAVYDVVMPPRKRRRTAADSPAFPGVRVISDIGGRRKAEPKLSSSLPVAGDSSIFAYSCGHSACCPKGGGDSTACYSTSGELLNHYKDKHMDDAGASDETPFRCCLKGCNKGWKSINGLQYHLQISKVHYQHFCSRAASTKMQTMEHGSEADASNARPSNVSRRGTKRLHKCPHPRCLKEYKQLSGLRYHLLHGHPKDIPAQFNAAPPTLARQLGVDCATEIPAAAVPMHFSVSPPSESNAVA